MSLLTLHDKFISDIHTYIIPPNESNFNVKKLKLWFKKCDDAIKPIVNEFILSTTYISYKNFLKYLLLSIDEMIHTLKITTLQFFIPDESEDYTAKSGFWIFRHIKIYIEQYYSKKKYNITFTNDISEIDLKKPIIIPDDASYSGSQISSFIEKFALKKCDIYILIPFISNTAIDVITNSFLENKIDGRLYFIEKNKFIMKPIYEIMDSDKIIELFKYYTEKGTNIRSYPIYFDHKIADSYSSFPLIYSYGVVANEKNKSIINDCRKKSIALKTKFKELDRIVFIENCIQNDTYFDINKPNCPLQPYKQNFIRSF